MTAATLTPAAAGADLLDQLRQLVQRHDSASSVEEVRQICDEVTAVLRRTRGRINRFAKQAAEQAAPKEKPEPKPCCRGEARRGRAEARHARQTARTGARRREDPGRPQAAAAGAVATAEGRT
jgi:hypothetical protein